MNVHVRTSFQDNRGRYHTIELELNEEDVAHDIPHIRELPHRKRYMTLLHEAERMVIAAVARAGGYSIDEAKALAKIFPPLAEEPSAEDQ